MQDVLFKIRPINAVLGKISPKTIYFRGKHDSSGWNIGVHCATDYAMVKDIGIGYAAFKFRAQRWGNPQVVYAGARLFPIPAHTHTGVLFHNLLVS